MCNVVRVFDCDYWSLNNDSLLKDCSFAECNKRFTFCSGVPCALRAMIISDWAFFLAVVYRDFVLVNDAEFESLREELIYFLNVQSTSNIQDPFYETTFEETLQTKSKKQMFLYIFESNNCSQLLQIRLQFFFSLCDLNAFLDVFQEHIREIVPAVEEFIACCHYQCKCMSFDQLVQLFGQLKDAFSAFVSGAPMQQASSSLLLQVRDFDSVETVEERIHEYFDLHSCSSK